MSEVAVSLPSYPRLATPREHTLATQTGRLPSHLTGNTQLGVALKTLSPHPSCLRVDLLRLPHTTNPPTLLSYRE